MTDAATLGLDRFQKFGAFLDRLAADVYPEPPSEIHGKITEEMVDFVFANAHLPENPRVLDVGCGQAPALDLFRRRGCDCVGVTIGDEDLGVCRKKGHNVFEMDQSFLQFDNGSFDLVWARHCVEHSVAPLFTLHGFADVLGEHGWLYLEVPAPDTACHHEQNPNHYSVLTKSSWVSLLQRSGFSVADSREIKLNTEAGPDVYWAFLCEKTKTTRTTRKDVDGTEALYLGFVEGENFGWGICGKYLLKELAKLVPVVPVRQSADLHRVIEVQGKALTGIATVDFDPIIRVRGKQTYAYAFFEFNPTEVSLQNALAYDRVLCGSTWCSEKLNSKGVQNTGVLIQGVDPTLFSRVPERKSRRGFIVFSGGKLEYRKAQDVVVKAMQILQDKYSDIILVTSWFNLWPMTMELLRRSPHITFDVNGDDWEAKMRRFYVVNDLDPTRVVTVPLLPNNQMRELYGRTDIGLFPNRCEGGTNLVMMEYMACGRTVIATNATGHKDVITRDNSFPLTDLKPDRFAVDDKLTADWVDPSVDEVVAMVEYAYHHRDEMDERGRRAALDMQRFSWEQSARTALHLMDVKSWL